METTEEKPINKNKIGDFYLKKPHKIWLWYILAIFCICLISLISWQNLKTAKNGDLLTLEPKKIGFFSSVKNLLFNSDNLLEGQKEDRINILLLGIGGSGHDGPYLSDTNIIVSIKPSTNEVAMTSVPRDLGVKVKDKGINKINFASAVGEMIQPGQGGEYARQVFEETFNIPIPYYVQVDFQAFTEIINLIGGLDVEIKNSFIDQAYPGPDYSYQTVQFEKGVENMNGERALIYSRSRHGTNGENSDFARSRRQQQIISLLKNKLLSFETYSNPLKVKEIIESLSSHIQTNLNVGQLMYLGNMVRNTQENDIKNLVLDSGIDGFTVPYIGANGAFMLAPRGGKMDYINYAIEKIFNNVTTTPNWSAIVNDESIYKFTQEQKSSSTTDRKSTIPVWPNIKIEILNGTWRAGLASRYQNKLSDEGFNVVSIGNAEDRPVEKTVIYLKNNNLQQEILDALAKEISGKIVNSLPQWYLSKFTITTSSLPNNYEGLEEEEKDGQTLTNPLISDIIIVLGTDAKE